MSRNAFAASASFIHGQGYCQAVEDLMNIAVPKRAKFLRVIWGEMSRIHSHLLWLGLAADAFGFESLLCIRGASAKRCLTLLKKPRADV